MRGAAWSGPALLVNLQERPRIPRLDFIILQQTGRGGPSQETPSCIMTPSCSVVSTASFQSGSVHCTRACFRPACHHQTLRLSLLLLAFLHLFCSSSFVVACPFPLDWFPGVSLPAAPLFPGPRFRFSARRVALKIELPNQAEYGFSERGPRSIAWLRLLQAPATV